MNDLESYLFYRDQREEAPPVHRSLVAADGYLLQTSVFTPPGEEGRGHAVVIASGTGVRRGYYAPFARWLASLGFGVVTFDYRGIGDSKRVHAASVDATMHDWGERDLSSVVRWASDALGNGTVSIVGHSVGGQLVGLLNEPSCVRAVVTIGAQSGDYRLWPLPSRLYLALLWHAVVPGVAGTLGYLPGAFGIGEDLPSGVALEWARWCRTPGYFASPTHVPERRAMFSRLTAPLLAMGFADDDYAPPAAVDALVALYDNALVTRRHVARDEATVGHFGFFKERFRTTLWQEAADFLGRH